MDVRDLIFVALPFVVAIALGVGFLLVFQQRAAMDEAIRRRAQLTEPDLATPLRDPPPVRRPWWGNPWVWLGVSVAFVLLGIFVWPGLFGGTFFFLPFIWIWRPRQRPVDPRTNGHSKREDPSSLGGWLDPMSSFLEVLGEIGNLVFDAGDYARRRAFDRGVDIEPFVDALEAATLRNGGERCGDDRLCLEDAALVFEAQPLLSPERRGLAEQAMRQLDDIEGLSVTRVERSHGHVLAAAGSTDDGWIEVRILAHRGWLFLIGAAHEAAARRLAAILDEEIDRIESSSTG